MRRRIALGFLFVTGVVAASACDGERGTSGNGGGPYQGPCAQYEDCVACTEAVDECEWCGGLCVVAPAYDDPDPPGLSCDWGWASSSSVCTEDDGIRIQPTSLDVDCRAVKNEEEPRCARGELNPASIGGGPAFPAESGSLYGGFVDAASNRVVLGAITSGPANHGSIWSVDLATGDRTLVSGVIVDPIQGELTRGSGPAFGTNVVDVEPLSGSAWIAWTVENSSPMVFRVDAGSGNRTLIYEEGKVAPCAHAGLHYRFANFSSTSDPLSIVVASNGTVYVPAGDAAEESTGDVGIAALSPNGTCTLVTLGSADASRRIGGGPAASSGYRALVQSGGTLYALARSGQLHAVDIASGNRTLISEEGILGEGPGLHVDLLAMSGESLWTTGSASTSYDDFIRVDVDPATGLRSARHAFRGPLEGKTDQALFTAPHPTLEGVAVIALEQMVVIYEPSSGNNLVLSH